MAVATALHVAPISQDCSDVELVAAVRHGNDTAFEELYSRYSHRIVAYVRGMVGDHGRAEDITQEIFIAALRRMRETERPIAFKPWIYEIAKNACIDSFRRTRRAQEVSLDADDRLSSADRGRLTVVTTPDAALDSKQALHDLRGAFGGLSESHHEILVLRELEGRTYSDIGQRLGMSRPVVESTLFRARRRLAEEYDELASGRRCEFVRKMVDSGPQYSLGIRDRRRMARHFAHCQACRAHARIAGFDESILNMPSVAAKIAALLPIPFLRARWVGVEHFGCGRGRPSLLAWRSVDTLARSSDQIIGAGAGAGRGAAMAAALVLAGVGGGIVTVTSTQPSNPSHRSGDHASAYGTDAPAALRLAGPVHRTASSSRPFPTAPKISASSAHAGASSPVVSGPGTQAPVGSSDAGRGPTKAEAPLGSAPTTSDPDVPGTPSTTSGVDAPGGVAEPTAGGTGGAADTTTAGSTGDAADTTAAAAATGGAVTTTGTVLAAPTVTPTVPAGPGPTTALPTGTVATTVGGVAGTVSQLPPTGGTQAGSGQAAPLKGTISGTVAGVGQLVGRS